MKFDQDVSDEFVNAFVDDQLDAADKSRAISQIDTDTAFKERICEASRIKEMVRHAYRYERSPRRSGQQRERRSVQIAQALAVCLLLTIGAVVGWFAHVASDEEGIRGFQLGERVVDQRKIILHVASSDPEKLRTTLDETEQLLATSEHSSQPIQLEVIANGGGLDLLRADVSPYAARIKTLREEHKNLKFLACRLAMENLRGKGVQVHLLPDAEIAPSALDQIIMRLEQGWVYLKV